MNPLKFLGVTLVAAGILALAYGGFTYTRRTHEAKIGPMELTMQHRESVSVPMWAGIGAIVLGGILLVTGKKK
ncbi:MAG: hypothetical protein ACYCT1_05910 [Steroidobacteraceae bacterium]